MATRKKFFPKLEAEEILRLHTASVMEAARISTENILKMRIEDMFEILYDECAYVLTNRLVKGEYTMREYMLVRTSLSDLLYYMAVRTYEAEKNPDSLVVEV